MTSRLPRWLPLALTSLRALLGPVVLVLAFAWPHPIAFAACLVAAFLSDVFDGMAARRLGIATPTLRRLDSVADSVFYVAALVAAAHLHGAALATFVAPLVGLLVLEVVRYAFDLAKFRREAAYHMWSSKLWGIALFAGFFSLLVFGRAGFFVGAAIWIGIVADLEGLAISTMLRSWRNDVPTCVHAWRIRRSATGSSR